MKTALKFLTALAALACAGLLIKLAAEVMGVCRHNYIEVGD